MSGVQAHPQLQDAEPVSSVDGVFTYAIYVSVLGDEGWSLEELQFMGSCLGGLS